MDATLSPSAGVRILIVDDEDRVREGLRWSLHLSGYQVDEAASGVQALAILGRGAFDVMLLDMNMPAMDGVEVMERARRQQSDLAIIVLTGHATLDSAIAAVKAGASDYLLKPVSIQNLQAAVSRALLARADFLRQQRLVELMGQAADVLRSPNRPQPAATDWSIEPHAALLTIGDLTLNVDKRLATVGGSTPRAAELTEAETAILQELMRHPDQVRSCRQLVRAAWGYEASEMEAAGIVRSHIFRLRKKLEVDPANPQYVKTVRGGGYFLAMQANDKKQDSTNG